MAASGRFRLNGLSPLIRPGAEWTIRVAEYYGIPVTVVSGYRSLESQRALRAKYDQCVATGQFGRTPECRYPANRPGESAHNYGLAFDAVVPEEWWPAWTWIRQYAGFRVLPNDRPHAEHPEWRSFV